MTAIDLVLIANARMPSQRAQSLQVVQMAAAFARAGASTLLLHAARKRTPALPEGVTLFDHYGIPPGPRPSIEAVACVDWIDRVPRLFQYVPARLQEQSFSRNAALRTQRETGARVLSREIEAAVRSIRAGHPAVFLEIHRVPHGRLRRKWLLEAAAKAHGLIAISGGVRDDLIELGVDAARVLVEHDGFEASRFEHRAARDVARATLALPKDVPLAVYTGGLLEWKGVDLVVEAARSLADVYFVIAGGMDADVKRLRQKAGGLANVRIDGFQPPERVPLYLAAGDVGLVPNRSKPAISARYTSPLKVFEAMAVGLPLVASDVPSLRELLTHEDDALLVAPDDSAALAAGVRRLMSDAVLRARLGQKLGLRARHFTWDARARRILDWMS
ncbi:MAG: glycosyltransferase family 4 protein [Planctomycetota bacterium]